MGGEALAVTDNGILGLLAQVVDEVHAIVDGAQLFEQLVYFVEEHFSVQIVGDDGVYHLLVALSHGVEVIVPAFIASERCLGRCDQLIGDSAKGAYHGND